ncbi:MAG: iron donor protein CyaY [Planctomycetota bacterium]
MNDLEFQTQADAFMSQLLDAMESLDPDEVDADLQMGVLSMEFADGSKCIMNRQTAAHQIWLAHGASAWHFAMDDTNARWMDTKNRGAVEDVLSGILSQKLGREIVLGSSA